MEAPRQVAGAYAGGSKRASSWRMATDAAGVEGGGVWVAACGSVGAGTAAPFEVGLSGSWTSHTPIATTAAAAASPCPIAHQRGGVEAAPAGGSWARSCWTACIARRRSKQSEHSK